MLSDFAKVFEECFTPSMPAAGFRDPMPAGLIDPSDEDLDAAIAAQDAMSLRVDLLSDELLDDLIAKATAERDRRPAVACPIAGRIKPAPHWQPAA